MKKHFDLWRRISMPANLFLKRFLAFSFFLVTDVLLAQTITVTNVSVVPVCSGNTVTVKFNTKSGNGVPARYDTDTSFIVYLSNSSGASFTSLATFSVTGVTFTGGNQGVTTGITHDVIIPTGTLPGTGYKISIGSTNPNFNAAAGAGASAAFTINAAAVPGTVNGAATVCSGTNSTTLTVSGNTGTIQWQSSADNITFGNLSGQTSSSFIAANLTATRYYRVVLTNGTCSATSDAAAVTVSPVSVAGSITGGTAVCAGINSTTLTLSGYVGSIQWQSSSDNVNFTNIPSANAPTFTALNLTATTYYRAVVKSGVCSSSTTFGSTPIIVNPLTVAGNIIGAADVCSGMNSTLLSLTGNIGAVQWQSSADNNNWLNINGATGTTFTALNLTATTYYRAVVASGACASANTPGVIISVSPASVAGTITAGQNTVCGGTNNTSLVLADYTGTIQWQSSSDDILFSDIIGATSSSYTATNLTAATYYRAVVKSGSCSSTATVGHLIDVSAAPIAGSVLGGGAFCAGENALLTASDYFGDIQWQSSPDNTIFTNIGGANAAIYNVTNIAGTTYYRIVVSNGACSPVSSAAISVGLGTTTTWNGTSWDNGEPTSTSVAIIAGNYTAASNLDACSLTINNNVIVNIPAGFDVTLNGSLLVSSGSFTLENNANLLQNTNAANSGNIIVKRQSSAVKRQDYTLWSSPVANQTLLAFSPLTVVNPSSRFYEYSSSANYYNSIADPGATTFADAKGYLIRVANNHPAWATIWNGQFTGVPHNGDYSFEMSNGGAGFRFNLVGNPYPSPISATAFAAANSANITGTLYFWRETNNNTLNNAYCSWSPAGGGNGTFVSNGESQVFNPGGVIQTGQGFFVEALNAATHVNFANSMRLANHINQFFRQSLAESPQDGQTSRIWLNVTNSAGAFCQAAIGYMDGATNGYDSGIDGRSINDGEIQFYSVIDGEKFVIQGKALPFSPADIVPLGFGAATAGDYSIAIDHTDGLFASEQQVFLKDNLNGTTHDLATPYNFTTEAGEFASRFDVVYQMPLSVSNPAFDRVEIVKQNGVFAVRSINSAIDNIKVFDVSGRLLLEKKAVGANATTFAASEANQVLIVKITSDDNRSIIRKVVN